VVSSRVHSFGGQVHSPAALSDSPPILSPQARCFELYAESVDARPPVVFELGADRRDLEAVLRS
jgi:hypothetical protein